MLRVLERNYKQSIDSAEIEFPNCHLLFSVDNVNDGEGYLLVVSDSVESNDAFFAYIKANRNKQPFSHRGFYAEEVDDSVIY